MEEVDLTRGKKMMENTSKVTKELKGFRFKGGSSHGYTIDIPAGLLVKPADHGQYFLDELPLDLFPVNSFERHDATYYGVRLNEEHVVEKEKT